MIAKTVFSAIIIILTFNIIIISADTLEHKNLKLKSPQEPQKNWSINVSFSDNGFGFGASKFFNLNKDLSMSVGMLFSAAKDDREFDQTDIFGNSVTPYKINRLFMFPILNIGMQYRMFREDVTDNMRPFINFGVSPSAIIYTPYDEPFFSSFKYARAKYTIGGYAGIGLDYVTGKKSALSFNVRYYYIRLFGEGIRSISTNEIKNFGGIFFIFSYSFMK
jgi:outer membrane protein W